MQDVHVRMAEPADAAELLEIYRPYVEKTAISFEYETPTVEEFRRRIAHILERYPYLAAMESGTLVGYAYAAPFKARAAYDWSVETTVYIRQDCVKRGCGKRLYLVLEELLRRQNILNANACIAVTEGEDPYLTNNSMEFHSHMGYRLVGRFQKCGCKFGRWYDMVWMEKLLGEHGTPQPVIPVGQLR